MSTTPGGGWRRSTTRCGKPQQAPELRAKAANLFQRFNEAFWDEESGFYAFCLDGEKKPVLSVASNPGHLLWSGIVPRDRAARVVEAADGAGHVERLGHPHAVGRSTRPTIRTPTRTARSGRTTTA